MHPHRIEVLDGTDDDRVVGLVTHDLELVLLPTEHRLLDQDLRHRAGIEPTLGDIGHLLAVVSKAGTPAAEDERRTDDHRVANLVGHLQGSIDLVGQAGARHRQADLLHRRFEPRAILGGVDRLDARPDQLDAVRIEHPGLVQPDRQVERGLAPQGRENGVGPLPFDDPGDTLHIEWLDVGRIGELRVGHDRRRVRVHQDHPVALAAQHPTGLGAGVVELAGLTDDDRPAPQDEDR